MTPLIVLHEDDHLVAVAKPSGQAVTPGGGTDAEPSVQEQVAAHTGGRVFVVHRLDRGTSGVILFAKDAETHRRLSLLFEAREVRKTYLALVLGHVDPPSGEVSKPLRAFGSGRVAVDRRGKAASTGYQRRERLTVGDLLEVHPVTGRRHQVRVHLYAIGHPILGDTRYGHERPVGGVERLMLHAGELLVPDADGGMMTLRAEPTADFVAIVERHRSA